MKERRSWQMLTVMIFTSMIAFSQTRLKEDFERNLSKWELVGAENIKRLATGDPSHGYALLLHPNEVVYAIAKGSEAWGGVRIEGEVLFLGEGDGYLGVLYNGQKTKERVDFGCIYILKETGVTFR